jgi:hypothetical protein
MWLPGRVPSAALWIADYNRAILDDLRQYAARSRIRLAVIGPDYLAFALAEEPDVGDRLEQLHIGGAAVPDGAAHTVTPRRPAP